MAIAHEYVTLWTFDLLSQAIAERIQLGLPTLILDRRVVSGDVASDDLPADTVAFGQDSTVDLADASRWLALIVPDAGTLQRDLQSFARALAIWCAPLKVSIADGMPNFARATGNPRITDLIKALYDGEHAPVVQSIGSEVLCQWRSVLRDLGEGPRAVVDDPWFSHLFLSPKAGEFPMARPCTRLDLRSPRVPQRAARQIATVVFDRLLEQRRHQDATVPELVCFVLEGSDLEPALRPKASPSANDDACPTPNVRMVWIDEVENPKLDATPKEILPKSNDDSILFQTFSNRMDKRHRAAYVKGMMYGYPAFCQLEDTLKLPEDLALLRKEGMMLGMSSPLIELFED